MTSYVTGWTDYFASFSLSQVALKVVDSSLDLVDGALNKVGSEETGTMRSGVRTASSSSEPRMRMCELYLCSRSTKLGTLMKE